MKYTKLILTVLVSILMTFSVFSGELLMEGSNCAGNTDTSQADYDVDSVIDLCDLCPLESVSGSDVNNDGCVDGTSDSKKEIKFSEYEVVSDLPVSQLVEIGQETTWVKTVKAKRSHSTVSVSLPAEATNIQVFALYPEKTELTTVNTHNLADKTLVVVNFIPKKDLEIYYTLPGPVQQESIVFADDAKNVKVSSPYHYTNVLTRTKINPLPQNLVELYRVTGGVKEPVTVLNYLDEDGDGLVEAVEWIVPHLSEETFQIGLKTSFNSQRTSDPTLPSGWYVQADGLTETDDPCLSEKSWELTAESFSGLNKGIMYTPVKDTIGCGLKLPTFAPNVPGVATIEFNFKSSFKNPESHMEILNYGFDNCDVKFGPIGVVEANECTAIITDLGNDWKKVAITNWQITEPSEPILLFLTPPYLLYNHELLYGEEGSIIFDDMVITLP